MQSDDTFEVTGELHIVLFDEATGVIKHEETVKNLVVTAGKNWIASRMNSAAAAVMGWMAVGTGVTAPAAGDTTLQTELARVALSTSGGTVAANVVTYSATFPAGTGTGTLGECGLFNAAAAGTMQSRAAISLTKGATDGLTITWTTTIN